MPASRRPGANISLDLIIDIATAAESIDPGTSGASAVRTWLHSGSDNAFGPHFDQDGNTYFDDEDYLNQAGWDAGEFPFVDVLAPGDHNGCGCELEVEVRIEALFSAARDNRRRQAG